MTSESAGGLSRSYAAGGVYGSDSELGSTGYGQMYLGLVKRSPAALPVVP